MGGVCRRHGGRRDRLKGTAPGRGTRRRGTPVPTVHSWRIDAACGRPTLRRGPSRRRGRCRRGWRASRGSRGRRAAPAQPARASPRPAAARAVRGMPVHLPTVRHSHEVKPEQSQVVGPAAAVDGTRWPRGARRAVAMTAAAAASGATVVRLVMSSPGVGRPPAGCCCADAGDSCRDGHGAGNGAQPPVAVAGCDTRLRPSRYAASRCRVLGAPPPVLSELLPATLSPSAGRPKAQTW